MRKVTQKKDPLTKSFGYAFQGIFAVILKERNMKIHCFMTAAVVIFGAALKINRQEWFTCLILFALVMSLEMVNTAVEAAVDLATDKIDPRAKLAKDAAAGAVLVAAIFAAVIGLIIFLPKLYAVFF